MNEDIQAKAKLLIHLLIEEGELMAVALRRDQSLEIVICGNPDARVVAAFETAFNCYKADMLVEYDASDLVH
jgi:hypothetical protein